jgi:hypothetical protein
MDTVRPGHEAKSKPFSHGFLPTWSIGGWLARFKGYPVINYSQGFKFHQYIYLLSNLSDICGEEGL